MKRHKWIKAAFEYRRKAKVWAEVGKSKYATVCRLGEHACMAAYLGKEIPPFD